MTFAGRMKFGLFLAPHNRAGENPTLALDRDLDIIEQIDRLGYDEVWVGEHHSGGWDIITDPTVFIATAAQRTRHIRLGTGVISLPYHHPLMVTDRMVLLDHLTKGRTMLGVGPGGFIADAYMMGIDPMTQRGRMNESLAVIQRLLRGEVVNYSCDWFELHDARLQLLPFTRPCFEIAVACVFSPNGPIAVGTHGTSMISVSSTVLGHMGDYAAAWKTAEDAAAAAGNTISRDNWRLVMPFYVAETRKQALNDVAPGFRDIMVDYYANTLGRNTEPGAERIENLVERGLAIVGSPEDAISAIERLQERSGGFGCLLNIGFEWASHDKICRSYELWARRVAPHFQGTLSGPVASNRWVSENAATIFKPGAEARRKAFEAAGLEMPEDARPASKA